MFIKIEKICTQISQAIAMAISMILEFLNFDELLSLLCSAVRPSARQLSTFYFLTFISFIL
jgi:hypothetical protein